MLKASEVTITKNEVNGSYECSALVNGHLARMTYYGYTKREALRLFVSAVKDEEV